MKIEKLYCYPIKSLPGESLDTTFLQTGKGLPGDRQFALTHATSKFLPESPSWLHRRNFVTLARSPQMHCLSYVRVCKEDTAETMLRVSTAEAGDSTVLFDADLQQTPKQGTPSIIESPALLNLLKDTQPGPHRLISAPGHSLWDAPFASVTLFNLASLQALAQSAGIELEPTRFRGNLWFSGVPAWQELDWVNSTLTLTSADSDSKAAEPALQLRIVDLIERCRVINANPFTGKRDSMLTRHLLNHYGHCDFGVHAEVVGGGHINVGESFNLQLSEASTENTFKAPF